MQEGVQAGSKYRRTMSVLIVIGLAMLVCAKVSAASRQSGGFAALAQTMLEASDKAGSSFEGTTAQNADAAAAKTSMSNGKAGWSKAGWGAGDWMSWVIPGPIVTCLAVGVMFSMYGSLWASGLAVILVAVDVVAFYNNI